MEKTINSVKTGHPGVALFNKLITTLDNIFEFISNNKAVSEVEFILMLRF